MLSCLACSFASREACSVYRAVRHATRATITTTPENTAVMTAAQATSWSVHIGASMREIKA